MQQPSAGEWRHAGNIALYRSRDGTLSLRRGDDGLGVYIDFGATADPLTDQASVRVTYRLDAHARVDETWRTAPDGRGAFSVDPLTFTHALLSGTTLVLEVHGDSAVRRLEIDLADAAQTIRSLLPIQ
ncbi:MAG: hypothetical protein WD081_04535 [Gammaproteobacteria bacterium]